MKFIRGIFQKRDYETAGFLLLLLLMAVYYGYRMFALTPWYDELYTYYFFISRGPVYAAIHWPVPNNHVAYSVLSAFLAYLGNPYIGLRGISYLCALANMGLLFGIGRKYLPEGFSLAAVLLYISMNLVNQLAVQGRGYTLGVTCYLFAFSSLIQICESNKKKRFPYILFAVSLVIALYTLSSDVYFVLPLCLTGGLCLLYRAVMEAKKENCSLKICSSFQKLLKLIAASLAAAAVTIFLYSILWLAIGSNLLVKEENGQYYGMSHVSLIVKAPFAALMTGIKYMLASPYIQSVERKGFLLRLAGWFQVLLNWYYDGLSRLLTVFVFVAFLIITIVIIKKVKNKETNEILFPLFLWIGILCMPLLLILQCALPYYRVFVYGGVLLAFSVVFCIREFWLSLKKHMGSEKAQKSEKILTAGVLLFSVSFSLFCFLGKGYQNQYGIREYEIEDALSAGNIRQAQNPCVTDCTQQYLIKFLYDITCENREVEGSDFLLLDKKMTDPDYKEMEWEFYHYYNTIPWDYVGQNMKQVYENENFVLYVKK